MGPASISVAITLGANTTHHYGLHAPIVAAELVAMSVIALTVFLCYAFASALAWAQGETGMSIIVRLSPFLLICVGVQITWNGARALLSSMACQVL